MAFTESLLALSFSRETPALIRAEPRVRNKARQIASARVEAHLSPTLPVKPFLGPREFVSHASNPEKPLWYSLSHGPKILLTASACNVTTLLQSGMLFGVREGRCKHRVGGVGALITGDETFTDAGVHGAEGSAGFVCKALEVRPEEGFLEVFARVPGHDFIAQLRRKLIETFSEHIETDTRIKQSYFGRMY